MAHLHLGASVEYALSRWHSKVPHDTTFGENRSQEPSCGEFRTKGCKKGIGGMQLRLHRLVKRNPWMESVLVRERPHLGGNKPSGRWRTKIAGQLPFQAHKRRSGSNEEWDSACREACNFRFCFRLCCARFPRPQCAGGASSHDHQIYEPSLRAFSRLLSWPIYLGLECHLTGPLAAVNKIVAGDQWFSTRQSVQLNARTWWRSWHPYPASSLATLSYRAVFDPRCPPRTRRYRAI
jgi:hypothetical protein